MVRQPQPWILLCSLMISFFQVRAQVIRDTGRDEIAFVSDTQAPMLIEKLYLKAHHNTRVTQLLFGAIDQKLPRCVFILGDVVSKGRREKKWRAMDRYLATLRKNDIPVYALLGNHDLMGNPTKGQEKFNKRFPEHVGTGYYKVVDSIAVVLLNSNFRKLTAVEQTRQQTFYEATLRSLDENPGVKFIIVTCHHAPYSNSRIVGSSPMVQQKFVPQFIQSKKGKFFITGHAHVFEWFQIQGKDFLTIGGGGGLHQPLNTGTDRLPNQAADYNPEFHYLTVRRVVDSIVITSYQLANDLLHLEQGYQVTVFWSQ